MLNAYHSMRINFMLTHISPGHGREVNVVKNCFLTALPGKRVSTLMAEMWCCPTNLTIHRHLIMH